MPYADPNVQREAKAARARRQRAAARGTVEPAVTVPAPTREALHHAGVVLRIGRADDEPDDAFRGRLRAAWYALLAVVADDSTHRDP